MKTTIKEQNDEIVVFFEGRLDTAASPQTEKEIQPILDVDKDIVLDCEKLDYISSSGLRIFLSILKEAKPRGHKVSIVCSNQNLIKIFTVTGFTNLFEFR
jgi:anti-anti-sigma factor